MKIKPNIKTKTLVISAYPACGKSTFYKTYSKYAEHDDNSKTNNYKILDSDSSKFSWIYDNNGNKTDIRNPDFPNNYVNYIKSRIGKEDIIFVSSHKIVRNALYKSGILYFSVYPEDTIANKKEWKSRFLNRNDSSDFISFQMNHWTEFINEMTSDITPEYKYPLNTDKGVNFINIDMIHDMYGWLLLAKYKCLK